MLFVSQRSNLFELVTAFVKVVFTLCERPHKYTDDVLSKVITRYGCVAVYMNILLHESILLPFSF